MQNILNRYYYFYCLLLFLLFFISWRSWLSFLWYIFRKVVDLSTTAQCMAWLKPLHSSFLWFLSHVQSPSLWHIFFLFNFAFFMLDVCRFLTWWRPFMSWEQLFVWSFRLSFYRGDIFPTSLYLFFYDLPFFF